MVGQMESLADTLGEGAGRAWAGLRGAAQEGLHSPGPDSGEVSLACPRPSLVS